MGLIRDIIFARFFGAGLATDAFFVAFKIPNFMRRVVQTDRQNPGSRR